MEAELVEKKILQLISKALGIELCRFSLESNLKDELGADSIDMADLLFKLEDAFKIDFFDHEVAELKIVGDIVNTIKGRV